MGIQTHKLLHHRTPALSSDVPSARFIIRSQSGAIPGRRYGLGEKPFPSPPNARTDRDRDRSGAG